MIIRLLKRKFVTNLIVFKKKKHYEQTGGWPMYATEFNMNGNYSLRWDNSDVILAKDMKAFTECTIISHVRKRSGTRSYREQQQ